MERTPPPPNPALKTVRLEGNKESYQSATLTPSPACAKAREMRTTMSTSKQKLKNQCQNFSWLSAKEKGNVGRKACALKNRKSRAQIGFELTPYPGRDHIRWLFANGCDRLRRGFANGCGLQICRTKKKKLGLDDDMRTGHWQSAIRAPLSHIQQCIILQRRQ